MSEQYRFGVRVEYPNTNLNAFDRFVRISQFFAFITGLSIEGPRIPSEGPVLLTANHTSFQDIPAMAYTSFLSGRMVRGVARRDLVDLTYKEPKEVLKRVGKYGHFDPVKLPFIRPFIANTLAGAGAIGVSRERPRDISEDKKLKEETNEVLHAGEVLGMFFEDTRVKSGDLSEVQPGIGALILRHIDVPIVVASIWTKEFGYKIILHKAVTGRELINGRIRSREVAAKIADICASDMPEPIKVRWEEVYRPLVLNPPRAT